MKKVIFWDFDGTLVKSNQSFLTSLLKALEENKAAIPEEDCRRFLKSACSWYFPEKTYPGRTGVLWWQDLLQKLQIFSTACSVPVDQISRICSSFRRHVVSYPYLIYPDALPALKLANDLGFENYILSNNFPELKQIVSDMGMRPYVKEVLLSSDLGAEKPNISLFSAALERSGSPSLALMVGDNPIADIAGAKAAGMKTVLVHRDGPCQEADWIFSSLLEIPPLLKTL